MAAKRSLERGPPFSAARLHRSQHHRGSRDEIDERIQRFAAEARRTRIAINLAGGNQGGLIGGIPELL